VANTVPSFDAVLLALGGGALATGVRRAVKALAADVEVIRIQPLGASDDTLVDQRRVVTTDSIDSRSLVFSACRRVWSP